MRRTSMARLPWRRALTTMALGLLVFLPSIAPRAGAPWGRVAVVNASATAVINHDRNTLIIGSQYGGPPNLDPLATFTPAGGTLVPHICHASLYRVHELQHHQ